MPINIDRVVFESSLTECKGSSYAEAREREEKRAFCQPRQVTTELEADISRHEQLLEQLEADLGNPGVHRDGGRIKRITDKYKQTKAKLESLYEHWEEAIELN